MNPADRSRACLLRALDADKRAHPEFFHPSVGRRTRCYLSQNDVSRYESGWHSFKPGDTITGGISPWADGFRDAEAHFEEQFWRGADKCFEVSE